MNLLTGYERSCSPLERFCSQYERYSQRNSCVQVGFWHGLLHYWMLYTRWPGLEQAVIWWSKMIICLLEDSHKFPVHRSLLAEWYKYFFTNQHIKNYLLEMHFSKLYNFYHVLQRPVYECFVTDNMTKLKDKKGKKVKREGLLYGGRPECLIKRPDRL